jgi:sulfur carrier protein ThiS
MTVTLRLRDKDYEVRAGMTVRDALLQIGIEPDSVLPTRQGELITEDEILMEGEHIRLVSVISGGSLPLHHLALRIRR